MWKSKENGFEFQKTSSSDREERIKDQIKLEEETIRKLKRQKEKIIQMGRRYKSMETELEKKKSEVQSLTGDLKRANQKIVRLETNLNYEETQRTYVNNQLRKQNSALLEKLRSLEIQILAKEEQIKVLTSYESEYKQKNINLEKQLAEKNKSLGQTKEKVAKLGQLVQRQAQLLQKQDQESKQLLQENQQLERKLKERPDQEAEREKTAHHILEMNEHFRELARKLSKHNEDWHVLMELQKIRVMMRDLAKGEVEKIEDLVSSF